MDRDGSTLEGRVQAADRKYGRAGSSREKERSAFCKLGEMGRIPHICHGRADGVHVNFFWPV